MDTTSNHRILTWIARVTTHRLLTELGAVMLALAACASLSSARDGVLAASYRFIDESEAASINLEGGITVEPRDPRGTAMVISVEFEAAVLSFGAAESPTGTLTLDQIDGQAVVLQLAGVAGGSYHRVTLRDVSLGDGRILPSVSIVFGLLVSDLDGSGALDTTDINLFVSAFLADDLARADIDRNGVLNAADINRFVQAFVAGGALANLAPVVDDIADIVATPGVVSRRKALAIRDDTFAPDQLQFDVSSSNPAVIASSSVRVVQEGRLAFVEVETSAASGASATITLGVSDGASRSEIAFGVSVRENAHPQARLKATTYWGAAPLTVRFDSSPTIDTDGDVDLRLWLINGRASVGITREHTFSVPGEYVVALEVVDEVNASSRTQRIVTVVDPGAYDPQASVTPAEARRFLWQAAFGPSEADVDFVVANGYEAWIDQQLATPKNGFAEALQQPFADLDFEGQDFESYLDDYWLEGQDQLHQRMVFALTQVIVMSNLQTGAGNQCWWSGVKHYSDHAFGNYRDLLEAITYSRHMAVFLTYLDNRKADPDSGSFPDENYARELMQLFTIGLWELNPDGTLATDTGGMPLPTYDNTDVQEFARIFTGLVSDWSTGDAYAQPLRMEPYWHDYGQKQLLSYAGVVPAGGIVPASDGSSEAGHADVRAAIDNVFNHPNCGPFVSRLLIQRFTLSNPSPAYVGRVASVFNDNGSGDRGDLAAVVKAILLDPEARDPAYRANPGYGKRLEPLLVYFGLARALGLPAIRPDESFPYRHRLRPYNLGQRFMRPNSVFNFYLPDFSSSNSELDASGLVAPELQIHDYSIAPFAHEDFRRMLNDPLERYTDWVARAGPGETSEMLDLAIAQFSHREPTERTRTIIVSALEQIDDNRWEYNAPRMATALLAFSPEFMILR